MKQRNKEESSQPATPWESVWEELNDPFKKTDEEENMWVVVYGKIEELTAETCIAGNIVKDCSTLSLHMR